MAKHKERQVRIQNAGDGPQFTSPKKAIKYVTEKRARIVDEYTIEFVESDRRHLVVLKSIAAKFETTAPAKPRHSVNLPPVVPSSEGTNDLATFGRYPMFPGTAFRRRAA